MGGCEGVQALPVMAAFALPILASADQSVIMLKRTHVPASALKVELVMRRWQVACACGDLICAGGRLKQHAGSHGLQRQVLSGLC